MVHVLADTVDGEPVHRIAGLRDLTGEGGPTLGRVLIDYLANRPPVVAVTVTPPSGPSGTRFFLAAGTSRDPEGGPLAVPLAHRRGRSSLDRLVERRRSGHGLLQPRHAAGHGRRARPLAPGGRRIRDDNGPTLMRRLVLSR